MYFYLILVLKKLQVINLDLIYDHWHCLILKSVPGVKIHNSATDWFDPSLEHIFEVEQWEFVSFHENTMKNKNEKYWSVQVNVTNID